MSERRITLTKQEAERIRALRVDESATWREIAWVATNHKDSNTRLGMELCEVAAEMLGEKYLEEPWN